MARIDKLNVVARRVRDRVVHRMQEAMKIPLEQSLALQFEEKTGREYPHRQGFGIHKASAAGEPPAYELGDLARSMRIKVQKDKLDVVGVLYSVSKVALWLEEGAPNRPGSGTLEPRPFLVRSVMDRRKAFLKQLTSPLK